MPPPATCPSCNSSDIEADDFNGHGQIVCTSCGHICDQVNFYNEDGRHGQEGADNYCPPSGPITKIFGAKVKAHLKANVHEHSGKVSSNSIQWVKDTKKICHVQGLPSNMTDKVVTLFEAAYHNPKFKQKKSDMKQALGGACLYVVCRQNTWPILLKDIASAYQSQPSQVWEMYQKVVEEFSLEVPAVQEMANHVPSVLNKYGLRDQSMHKKTVEICALASDTWITCGRNFENVILAAGYLAWRSILKGKKQTLASFSRVIKGDLPQYIYQRVKELTDVIIRLAKEIPWISKKHLKADSIQYLIDDVLKNRKTLLGKCKPEDVELVQGTSSTENANCFMPPSQKKPKVIHDEPPCSSHLHSLANSEELCELDIPECDIHEYILFPEEVVVRERILKEFEEHDDETNSEAKEDGKDDNVVDQKDAESNCDENGDNNVVTGEKSVSENDAISPSCQVDDDKNTVTTEQESEVTDENIHKEEKQELKNPPKRKASLLSDTDEQTSKRPRSILSRNRQVKISEHKIARLARIREQRQASSD